jgi:hypothetical protein
VRYALTITLTLTACFGIQTLALHHVGGRTTKSESNFFSSIARIQNGLNSPSQIALLGSSRTGRLPDKISLKTQFPNVSNFGCDGATAAILLRAIDRGQIPPAETIIIEGNTLVHDLDGKGQDVEKFLVSPWFKIGVVCRLLRADARPSAIAYSYLLNKKIGGFSDDDGTAALLLPAQAKVVAATPDLPTEVKRAVAKMAAIINRLKYQNVRIMLVILPPPTASESMNMSIPRALSHAANIPMLDLAKDLPPGSVRYTDGVHMAPASAAAALRSILNAIKTLP